MRRIILLPLVALLLFGATVTPAAADPTGPIFNVTCTNGATFQVVGTGSAGHVIGSNSIAVLMSADFTISENGVIVDQFSITATTKAPGLPVLSCTAFREFQPRPGLTVRIDITNARILVTPARP